jgi:hypothetical protein
MIEICQDLPIVEERQCSIKMSSLWADFGLQFQDLPTFTVAAYNENGWGLASPPNSEGQTVLTPPRFMHQVQRDAQTNDRQIFVFWSSISTFEETGGSQVLSYGLEVSEDLLVWDQVQGYIYNSLEQQYTAQNVIKGCTYYFRLQAKNIYGWGVHSEVVEIKAAGIPSQMEIPQTSVAGQNVVVSWQVPYENSDFVSHYRAFVLAKDGQF